jgi:hypothetical protein
MVNDCQVYNFTREGYSGFCCRWTSGDGITSDNGEKGAHDEREED